VDHPPVRGLLHRRRSNAFYRKALAAGGQGVSVAFDLATHRGYDSDHPRVTGDVGKAGVAIDSVEDMKILFDGIPLDKVSVSHDHERRRAAGAGRLRGGGRRAGRGAGQAERDHPERHPQGVHGPQHLHLPARAVDAIIGDIIEYTAQHMPKFNSISISGYHMQEAGANQALELAFTLADGRST
jgi:methylmalonyl-CoA mutase